MIYIGSKRYACEKCIRGHRTKTCDHRDAKLVQVRPRGRPPSHCAACREARSLKRPTPAANCECSRKRTKALVKSTNTCITATSNIPAEPMVPLVTNSTLPARHFATSSNATQHQQQTLIGQTHHTSLILSSIPMVPSGSNVTRCPTPGSGTCCYTRRCIDCA